MVEGLMHQSIIFTHDLALCLPLFMMSIHWVMNSFKNFLLEMRKKQDHDQDDVVIQEDVRGFYFVLDAVK